MRFSAVDVRHLRALRDLVDGRTVERIITDPPWGIYDGAASTRSTSTGRVGAGRRPAGAGRLAHGAHRGADDARSALTDSDLVETASLPVLVNGKKATVLTVRHPDV